MQSFCFDSRPNISKSLTELKLHDPLLNANREGRSSSSGDISKVIVWLVNKFVICAVNEFWTKSLDIGYGFLDDYVKGQINDTNAIAKLPLLLTTIAYWKKEAEITELKLRGFVLKSCIGTKWSTLKSLFFHNVDFLDQNVLDSVIGNLPLIESLSMKYCTGEFDTLKASCLRRLVTMDIISKDSFKKIEINAPNLEEFTFINKSQDDSYKSCVIHDLAISKESKGLLIYSNTSIDDEWLNCVNVSCLPKLKILALHGCPKLRHVKISSTSLETITLFSEELEELNVVDVSNLRSLEVRSFPHIPSFLLNNTSALTTVRVWFWSLHHNGNITNGLKHEDVVNYLGLLNGMRTLELHNLEKFLLPKEIRKTLNPPLDGVKDQKVKYIIHQWKTNDNFSNLIDGLLWFSLRPETVIIKLPCVPKTLKFEYKEVNQNNKMEKCDYCKSLLVRCWRHCLDKVTVNTEAIVNTPISAKVDAELLEFFKYATKLSRNAKFIYQF